MKTSARLCVLFDATTGFQFSAAHNRFQSCDVKKLMIASATVSVTYVTKTPCRLSSVG